MSDVSGRVILTTALHARTAPLCGSDTWTRICSFAVPLVYSSEREECEALVARAGIADISARHCLRFEGPDAAGFLGFATTQDAALIGLGQTARVVWCDDSGWVRGEGLLARLAEGCFELTSSVCDHAWFADGALGFNVQVSDRTGLRGGIGLRGPHAEAILELAGFLGMPERGNTEADPAAVRGPGWRQSQVLLLRAAEGFELWMDATGAGVVWDRLMRVGAGFGMQPVGARVLEHARIEAGQPLAGTDWLPAPFAMRAQDLRIPQDLGVEPDPLRRFNGSEALAQRRRGCGSRLVQLSSLRPLVRGEVIGKGGSAGMIMSVAASPATERYVAMAWIRDELARPGSALGLPGTSGALDIEVVRLCHS